MQVGADWGRNYGCVWMQGQALNPFKKARPEGIVIGWVARAPALPAASTKPMQSLCSTKASDPVL
jgi:hypothetical protein